MDKIKGEPEDIGEEAEAQVFMRSAMLAATGDFFLFLGMLFMLLGIASFVTDFLGIKGAGEFLVGVCLVLLAGFLLMRTRGRIAQPKKRKEKPQREAMESYR